MIYTLQAILFKLLQKVLARSDSARRYFHTKTVRTIPFGMLRGWRIYGAFSDGVNMTLGIYERDGQRWLQSRLRGGPNFVAVDAGCYMGFYSLLIARILSETGGGTVFDFDPNKNNIACLERFSAAKSRG